MEVLGLRGVPRGLALPPRLYLVVRGRLAVLQPHAKGPGDRLLVLLHDIDAPWSFLGAAVIWGEKYPQHHLLTSRDKGKEHPYCPIGMNMMAALG